MMRLAAFLTYLALCSIFVPGGMAATDGQAASSQPGRAPAQHRYLAVVGLQTLGDEAERHAWVGIGVGEEIATRLASARGQVEMLERVQINELLAAKHARPMFTLGEANPELDLQCARALDEAAKQNKLYGADAIILGAVGCSAASLRATTRLVSITRGKAEDAVTAEMPRTQAGLETDSAALGAELAAKWCGKLGIPVTPEIKSVSVEKSGAYQAWCEARVLLLQRKYEECLERVKWAESQVSDLKLQDGLLQTRDEAWEMLLTRTNLAPLDKARLEGQMLESTRTTYESLKRAHAMGAYYYGRALERAGHMKEAEAEYRDCLAQRPGRLLWDFEAGVRMNQPAVVDGVAYVGSEDGRLRALDVRTGKLLWDFAGYSNQTAVVEDGVVYANSTPFGLSALDAKTGRALFYLATGAWADPPLLANGVAYVGSIDHHLRAFEAKTGKLLWNYEAGAAIHTPVVVGTVAYASSCDHHLRAFEATTGRLLWDFESSGEVGIPTVANGMVCAMSSDHHLRALDAQTGRLMWDSEAGQSMAPPAVVDGVAYAQLLDGNLGALEAGSGKLLLNFRRWINNGTPVVVNGVVYLGGCGGLAALDAKTGNVVWDFHLGGFEIMFDPVVVEGVAYAGSCDNHLRAFDAKRGTLQWSFEAEHYIRTPLVVDGVAYAVSEGRHLRAFDTKQGADPDYAEQATARSMHCLTGEGRAIEALRWGARLWRETRGRMAATARELRFAARAVQGSTNTMHIGLQAHVDGMENVSECMWEIDGGHSIFSFVVVDGVAYVTWVGGQLRAFDVKSGKMLCDFNADGRFGLPIVVDGVAYVTWVGGHLRAFYVKTGEILWDVRAGNTISRLLVVGGLVYAGSSDGHLRAFESLTGKVLWDFDAGPWVEPAVGDGVTFAISDSRHLYALDVKTGKALWDFTGGIGSMGTPHVVNGVAYVGSGDDHLRAFDAKTGRALWDFEAGNSIDTPVVVGGVAYAGSHDSHLRAFEAMTGKVVWDFKAGSRISTPTLVDGVACVGSEDGHLRAFEAMSGKVIWDFQAGPRIFISALVDGVAYTSSGDGHLRAFDTKTGKLLWNFEASEANTHLVLNDGRLLVASGHHLLAFDVAKIKAGPRPEVTWGNDVQFWSLVIWGKGGMAVRKIADGFALDQILRYDNWQSRDALAAEIDHLAKLADQPNGMGDWDGPYALALDPATLCPPELKPAIKPDLTARGIRPAAQFYLYAAKRCQDPKDAEEYMSEARRLAPAWEALK